jgi:hypothetical protein
VDPLPFEAQSVPAPLGLRPKALILFLCCAVLLVAGSWLALSSALNPARANVEFPRPLNEYHDQGVNSAMEKLVIRVREEPFNLLATTLFFCAIVHTFLTSSFTRIAHRYEHQFSSIQEDNIHLPLERDAIHRKDRLQFRARFWAFMGEVEAVFAIWLIPLFVLVVIIKGWPALLDYSAKINVAEPIFVMAIMTMAGSKPIIRLAEKALSGLAAVGSNSPLAWWLIILTVGPLLGSFITEPGAMTICALLLRDRVYRLGPSRPLRYATLGLLFVGVSIGGTLTHFAAPPVVMVASRWRWNSAFMLTNFGWRAVAGIVLSTGLNFLIFRKELRRLKNPDSDDSRPERSVPLRITVAHVAFMAWTVAVAHYPVLIILGLLFFLAFAHATHRHQHTFSIRGPLMVGLFLLALIFHGTLQQWWLEPVLHSLGEWPLMIGATILTGFNDNAAITYLASLVPQFPPALQYAVMAGAVTGGGLTVIANAPNPVGQTILEKEFGENNISPLGLFVAALVPTIIVGVCFMLLR